MAEVEMNIIKKHVVKVVYGESVDISGVMNVVSYNDREIVLKTADNQLVLKGAEMNIDLLDLERGEVKASGKLSDMAYTRNAAKTTLLKRLFK